MDNEKIEDVKGFLKKKKGTGIFRLFGKTNLRWFEVLFNDKILGYKIGKSDKKFKEMILFNEVTDFKDNLPTQDKNICDWKYGFQILTKRKKFILYAASENELRKWTFAFNIILKRIPEAFQNIKESVFKMALEKLEKPYLEQLRQIEREEELFHKRKIEEEFRMKKELEEKRIRKRLEDEDRKRRVIEMKQKEEEERLWRIEQEMEEERLRVLREEEERMRQLREEDEEIHRLKQIEEDKFRRIREQERLLLEKEKMERRLYDPQHDKLISEIDERVLNYEEDEFNNSQNKSLHDTFNRSMNRSLNNSNLNFKEDLDDWNYYNDFDEKIDEEELVYYNPIVKDILAKKEQMEEIKVQQNLKNLFKVSGETMHMNAPITLNITSTKEDNISINNNINFDKKEIFENTNSTLMMTEKNDIGNNEMEKIHQIPIITKQEENNNNYSAIKYKKPRFFKKRNDNNNNTANESTLNISSNGLDEKNHNDPNLGKTLISNITLEYFEKNNINKIKNPPEKEESKIQINVQIPNATKDNLISNYVTNPNKLKKEDDLLIIEDEKENWFDNPNLNIKVDKLNLSSNFVNLDNKFTLDESLNNIPAFERKNHSFNFNERDNSDTDMNFSIDSNEFGINNNNKLDQSIQNNKINYSEIKVSSNLDVIKTKNEIIYEKNVYEKKKTNVFKNMLNEDDDEFDLIINKKSVTRVPDVIKSNRVAVTVLKTEKDSRKEIKKEIVEMPKSILRNGSLMGDDSISIVSSKNNYQSRYNEINNYQSNNNEINNYQSYNNEINNYQSYNDNSIVQNNLEDDSYNSENLSGHDFSFENREKEIETNINIIPQLYKINGSFIEDFDEW